MTGISHIYTSVCACVFACFVCVFLFAADPCGGDGDGDNDGDNDDDDGGGGIALSQGADEIVSGLRPLSRLDSSPGPLAEELRFGLWGVVLWLVSALGIVAGKAERERESERRKVIIYAKHVQVTIESACGPLDLYAVSTPSSKFLIGQVLPVRAY